MLQYTFFKKFKLNLIKIDQKKKLRNVRNIQLTHTDGSLLCRQHHQQQSNSH